MVRTLLLVLLVCVGCSSIDPPTRGDERPMKGDDEISQAIIDEHNYWECYWPASDEQPGDKYHGWRPRAQHGNLFTVDKQLLDGTYHVRYKDRPYTHEEVMQYWDDVMKRSKLGPPTPAAPAGQETKE